MIPGEVIGGELGGHAAPTEGQAGSKHRHLRARMAERAHQIGDQAGQAQTDEHERDRELLGGMAGAARRSEQGGADDSDHDRAHRHVLIASGTLAQHPLGEDHQHQQSGRERRLHNHQRREQQRHDLQRPAEE